MTTHILGQILEKAGYDVEYVPAGYFNMWQAVADGDLHGSVEVWSSNIPEQFQAIGTLIDRSRRKNARSTSPPQLRTRVMAFRSSRRVLRAFFEPISAGPAAAAGSQR